MEYGLIGKKLGHSFSKEIHSQIGGYEYSLIELNEKEFGSFMQKKDFKAINVTIPYKEKVIPYLDYVSDIELKINAVNTVVNKNGKLYGYNTDYLGLKAMINHFNIEVNNKVAMILGTGGTSKTASKLLKDLNVKEIIYVSTSNKENTITYNQIDKYKEKVDLIINTTPVEMFPNNDKEIITSLEGFSNLKGVIDVVFNPLNTNLILKAKEKNIKCCGGLYMLVAQAFFASQYFLDKTLDNSLIDKVYQGLLDQKQNIVLIGMPSSGKSTIGKLLAYKLNKKFIDTDSLIINKINSDIASFINTFGEEKFREIEFEVIKEISKENDLVIATGGGAILNKDNVNYLKQNGKLIFIDRDINLLACNENRPLTKTYELLKKRYEERYPLYNNVCDIKVNNNTSLEDVMDEIGGKL